MNNKCLSPPYKKRYSTQKDAQTAIILSDLPLIVYFCKDCKGWHLTKNITNS